MNWVGFPERVSSTSPPHERATRRARASPRPAPEPPPEVVPASKIRSESPWTPGTFDLDEYVHGALKAGARGFLLKDAGPELLSQAIHAAANGEALIAPSVTVRLLAAFADVRTSQPPAQPIEPLTAREEEVLVTVARGLTNAEIADELHISLSTVKTHLASLMNKLGTRNRVEIAMWAYETKRTRA